MPDTLHARFTAAIRDAGVREGDECESLASALIEAMREPPYDPFDSDGNPKPTLAELSLECWRARLKKLGVMI